MSKHNGSRTVRKLAAEHIQPMSICEEMDLLENAIRQQIVTASHRMQELVDEVQGDVDDGLRPQEMLVRDRSDDIFAALSQAVSLCHQLSSREFEMNSQSSIERAQERTENLLGQRPVTAGEEREDE